LKSINTRTGKGIVWKGSDWSETSSRVEVDKGQDPSKGGVTVKRTGNCLIVEYHMICETYRRKQIERKEGRKQREESEKKVRTDEIKDCLVSFLGIKGPKREVTDGY